MMKTTQSVTYPSFMSLLLINSTDGQCNYNETNDEGEIAYIGLCLGNNYRYQCHHNDSNGNISLSCVLQRNDTACHTSFVDNSQEQNITLDCFSKQINMSNIGISFRLQNTNDCMFGILSDLGNEDGTDNGTLVVCETFNPVIEILTTFAGTNITQRIQHYYNIFGLKVNKRFVKSYRIPLLVALIVALIVALWLLGCCCYAMCYCCYKSMKENNNETCSTRTHKYSVVQRMPQSSNTCDV